MFRAFESVRSRCRSLFTRPRRVLIESNKAVVSSVLIILIGWSCWLIQCFHPRSLLAVLTQQWNSRQHGQLLFKSYEVECSSVVAVRRKGGCVYLLFRPWFFPLYLSATDTSRYRILSQNPADPRIYFRWVWFQKTFLHLLSVWNLQSEVNLKSLNPQKIRCVPLYQTKFMKFKANLLYFQLLWHR